jgi:hypothetical protein
VRRICFPGALFWFFGAPAIASPGFTEQDLPALLDRVSVRVGTPAYSGFTQKETEEDLDGDGNVTSTRMTKSRQMLSPDGSQRGVVIEGIEDGQDVTEKVRKFRDERDRKARARGQKRVDLIDLDIDLNIPFEAAERPNYRFSLINGDPSRPRVHFEPKSRESHGWIGDATIDAATATVLEMHGEPQVSPHFVDEITIQMEFEPTTPDGPNPARMVVVAKGHFLFFHKRMRYTSLFSDFQKLDAIPTRSTP